MQEQHLTGGWGQIGYIDAVYVMVIHAALFQLCVFLTLKSTSLFFDLQL